MNRRNVSHQALFCAAMVTAGFVLPARAVNLLSDPGFEYPLTTTAEPAGAPTDWSFYTASGGEIEREDFYNHTPNPPAPSPGYSIWPKVFQSGTASVYQEFNSGVQANTSYTFSGYYYFEANYSTTDAVVDVEMTFYGASGELAADAAYVYASPQAQTDDATWAAGNGTAISSVVNPPTSAWTQYSVTATAPAGTTSIYASFDYDALNTTSGSTLSAFADDADLEGAGNPPTIPTWGVDSSGDWNSTTNWNTFTVPDGVGAAAQFEGAISANRNVYTDIPVTVGSMLFNNANEYVIDGAGSLTLQASSGNATVTVQQGTQEINLPLTIASNTVFNVAANSTLVIADPISINSGLSLTQTGSGTVTYESTIKVGSSASIAFGSSSFANSLSLLSGSKASLSGSSTVLELQDGLSLASGATLDVGAGQVNVDYIGASPASTIAALLKSAYAGGTWTGSGITSSQVSHVPGTSVGYDDTGTQVQIKFTWIGDLDLSGTVDGSDLTALNYGAAHDLTGWQNGDLNYDGVINSDDYSLFQYGLALSAGRSISAVPEPGVAVLLAAGLLGRRRRSAKA